MTSVFPYGDPNIVLGVTGSIAAYKAVVLSRRLAELGAHVTVAMTPAAEKFVGSLTFEAVTGKKVYRDPVAIPDESIRYGNWGISHTDLGSSLDAMVIAPASANMLGKLAAGLADDAVALLALAAKSDAVRVLVPAMNPRMWSHPTVQENTEKLKRWGWHIIGPDDGETACLDAGTGRMTEPEEIAERTAALINRSRITQAGSAIPSMLILNGPSCEYWDDVRFISNGSSGLMGCELARHAFLAGWDVTVLSGPARHRPSAWISCRNVTSADEFLEAAKAEVAKRNYDFIASPAAIADYRPALKNSGKPARESSATLPLTGTVDVLATLASSLAGRSNTTIVAFSAESGKFSETAALEKARRKNADILVVNNAHETICAPDIEARIVNVKVGSTESLGRMTKNDLAAHLIRRLSGRS